MDACVRVFVWLKRAAGVAHLYFWQQSTPDTHAGVASRRVSHHASSICPGLERASACSHSLTHSLTQQSGHLKGRGVFVRGRRGSTARHKKTIALMDHARFSPRKQVVDGIACEIARQHFFNLVLCSATAQTHARRTLAPVFAGFICTNTFS